MKYFIVEGTINDAAGMNDEVMKEHMAYTQKAMDAGMILMSALKEDMSGGIFIIRAESVDEVERYLADEPMGRYGIQRYRIIGFMPPYVQSSPGGWFDEPGSDCRNQPANADKI